MLSFFILLFTLNVKAQSWQSKSCRSCLDLQKIIIFVFRRPVKCTFHHVSSDVTNLIFSSFGMRVVPNPNQTELSGSCTRSKANAIRSKFVNSMCTYPQCWFSIALPNNVGTAFLPFGENIGREIHVSFGSLLSTSRFLVHETLFDDRSQWTITFCNEQTLLIEHHTHDSLIRLTVSMERVNRNILVIDGDTCCDIILSMDTIPTDVRAINNTKSDRY